MLSLKHIMIKKNVLYATKRVKKKIQKAIGLCINAHNVISTTVTNVMGIHSKS